MSEISKEELIGKISLEYEKNKSQILAAVKNCNGEFSIVEMEKELDDFYSEEEMPNVSFTYDKGSIECFYFPDDVILEIINSIPRDIKKLTVKLADLSIVNDLKHRVLCLPYYGTLTNEELNIICEVIKCA